MLEPIWLTIIITIASGVAIGLIILFFEYRTKWFSKSQKSSIEKPFTVEYSPEKPSSAGFKKRPFPDEIIEEIDKQPLLRRKTAGESYVGLKVEWQLTLRAVSIVHANIIRLMMKDKYYAWVCCEINVSEYPEVKIAKEGIGVWVAGEISKVEGLNIDLVNCTIKFD